MAIKQSVYENGEFKMVESHVGLVINTYEQADYHDSDFFAVVWCPVKKKTEVIPFHTTRFPSYGVAKIDFDYEKYGRDYEMYLDEKDFNQAVIDRGRLYNDMRDKGKRVEVVRGRKHPKGIKGKVLCVTEERYGYRNYNYRVLVRTDDDRYIFVSASNLEAIPYTKEEEMALYMEYMGRWFLH